MEASEGKGLRRRARVGRSGVNGGGNPGVRRRKDVGGGSDNSKVGAGLFRGERGKFLRLLVGVAGETDNGSKVGI